MKILHVLRQQTGEIYSHVRALNTSLIERGVSSEILLDDSGDSWISQRRFAARLRSAAAKADIVHAHGFRAGWNCSQAVKGKWVFTAHTANVNKPASLIERINEASAKIAVSYSLCEELRAAGVHDVCVNPGGLLIREEFPDRLDARVRLGYEVDDKVVCSLGQLTSEKGHEDLIFAMQEVWYEHEDAKLLISGDGPERDKLLDISEGLIRRSNVKLIPKAEDPFWIYAAADLFVMPSKVEALGLAAIEAMSAGIPVVARRVGGLAELVDDGATGKLVDPDDYLGDMIADLLFAPTLMKTMGDAGRLRVRERFDMRRNVEEIEKIYTQCA